MKIDLLNKEDIFVNKNFKSKDEYYQTICSHLYSENKIDEEYLDSILKREEDFPTGLKLSNSCVAIPHTDYQHSKVTQLVITTLDNPILFKRMDDPKQNCAVNLVIQILFDSPEKQLGLLKLLMNAIQDESFVERVVKANSKEEIINLFIEK